MVINPAPMRRGSPIWTVMRLAGVWLVRKRDVQTDSRGRTRMQIVDDDFLEPLWGAHPNDLGERYETLALMSRLLIVLGAVAGSPMVLVATLTDLAGWPRTNPLPYWWLALTDAPALGLAFPFAVRTIFAYQDIRRRRKVTWRDEFVVSPGSQPKNRDFLWCLPFTLYLLVIPFLMGPA